MVTDLLSWIAQERDLAFAALMLMGFIEACPGLRPVVNIQHNRTIGSARPFDQPHAGRS